MMVVGRHFEYFSHIINYIHKNSTVYISYLARNKLTFFVPISFLVIMCNCIFFKLKCMYNVKFIVFFLFFRPKNKSNNFFCFPNTDILIPCIIPRDLTPISIICIEKITETNNSYWLWRPSWKILKKFCLHIPLSGKQVKSGLDMSEPLKKHSHCSPMAMGTHTFQIFQSTGNSAWSAGSEFGFWCYWSLHIDW